MILHRITAPYIQALIDRFEHPRHKTAPPVAKPQLAPPIALPTTPIRPPLMALEIKPSSRPLPVQTKPQPDAIFLALGAVPLNNQEVVIPPKPTAIHPDIMAAHYDRLESLTLRLEDLHSKHAKHHCKFQIEYAKHLETFLDLFAPIEKRLARIIAKDIAPNYLKGSHAHREKTKELLNKVKEAYLKKFLGNGYAVSKSDYKTIAESAHPDHDTLDQTIITHIAEFLGSKSTPEDATRIKTSLDKHITAAIGSISGRLQQKGNGLAALDSARATFETTYHTYRNLLVTFDKHLHDIEEQVARGELPHSDGVFQSDKVRKWAESLAKAFEKQYTPAVSTSPYKQIAASALAKTLQETTTPLPNEIQKKALVATMSTIIKYSLIEARVLDRHGKRIAHAEIPKTLLRFSGHKSRDGSTIKSQQIVNSLDPQSKQLVLAAKANMEQFIQTHITHDRENSDVTKAMRTLTEHVSNSSLTGADIKVRATVSALSASNLASKMGDVICEIFSKNEDILPEPPQGIEDIKVLVNGVLSKNLPEIPDALRSTVLDCVATVVSATIGSIPYAGIVYNALEIARSAIDAIRSGAKADQLQIKLTLATKKGCELVTDLDSPRAKELVDLLVDIMKTQTEAAKKWEGCVEKALNMTPLVPVGTILRVIVQLCVQTQHSEESRLLAAELTIQVSKHLKALASSPLGIAVERCLLGLELGLPPRDIQSRVFQLCPLMPNVDELHPFLPLFMDQMG